MLPEFLVRYYFLEGWRESWFDHSSRERPLTSASSPSPPWGFIVDVSWLSSVFNRSLPCLLTKSLPVPGTARRQLSFLLLLYLNCILLKGQECPPGAECDGLLQTKQITTETTSHCLWTEGQELLHHTPLVSCQNERFKKVWLREVINVIWGWSQRKE
jgi:hypothetical protein